MLSIVLCTVPRATGCPSGAGGLATEGKAPHGGVPREAHGSWLGMSSMRHSRAPAHHGQASWLGPVAMLGLQRRPIAGTPRTRATWAMPSLVEKRPLIQLEIWL